MSVDRCYMRCAMIVCALIAVANHVHAQRYPVKVVRLVVPFSPGSGSDTLGRIIAAGLTEVFSQQVIVDNRAGAAGNIGADLVAKAVPDGYSLLLGNIGHAANVTLYRNLPYDLVRDFAPVTQLASAPALVVAHPSLPVKSLTELVSLAKAKPPWTQLPGRVISSRARATIRSCSDFGMCWPSVTQRPQNLPQTLHGTQLRTSTSSQR